MQKVQGGDLPAIRLPKPLDDLLQRRILGWNDPAALSKVYTDDAIVLEATPVSGGSAASQFVARRFGASYDIIPLKLAESGSGATIAAAYTRGEGADRVNVGLALITVRRGPDGEWRIAGEAMRFPGPPAFKVSDAAALIKLLDEAEISRAVIMSSAYFFESPLLPKNADAPRLLREENDWTAAQVARFPDRLVAFCGINPLTEQAIAEMRRCQRDLRMKGVKLHFGNSGVDLEKAEHLKTIKDFFAAAAALKMPVAVHLWGPGIQYGRRDAELFLSEILPAAPSLTVQIMHMAGGGPGWTDEALDVFARAVEAKDARARNLYFDVATVADLQTAEQLSLLARRIRQIGPERILYGSDASIGGRNTPNEEWGTFRGMVPLTDAEFATIRSNVAPYLR
jgi:predicted TIM-barrel fold metal-dependent hydrolase/ketosteroid isomerase-like protein